MYQFTKNVAERFHSDLQLDQMPSSPSVMVDFFPSPDQVVVGKTTKMMDYYAAYQQGIRSGRITPQDLDEAVGKGAALTLLVQAINPALNAIKTDYDLMPSEPIPTDALDAAVEAFSRTSGSGEWRRNQPWKSDGETYSAAFTKEISHSGNGGWSAYVTVSYADDGDLVVVATE